MKPNSRLDVEQNNWHNQRTEYPPSPDSQTTPQLLPKRPSKKKGLFSGKIPWVVYFVSLVQVTVFVVEIIKNCESKYIIFARMR